MTSLYWIIGDGPPDDRLGGLVDALGACAAQARKGSPANGDLMLVADANGSIPGVGEAVLSTGRRILVGSAWWRRPAPPIDELRRVDPAIVVGDLLPEEWPATWTLEDRAWIGARFAWLPPLQADDAASPSASAPCGDAILVVDAPRYLASQGGSAECGDAQACEPGALAVASYCGIDEILPWAGQQTIETCRHRRAVYSLLSDPADAHRLACAIDRAGGGFFNLGADAALQRGPGMARLLTALDRSGAPKAVRLRGNLDRLSRPDRLLGRGILRAEDAVAWMTALLEARPSVPSIAFSLGWRRSGADAERPGAFLRAAEPGEIDRLVPGGGEPLIRGEVVAVLKYWSNPDGLRTFRALWHKWKAWPSRAVREARLRIGEVDFAADPLLRVGWGLGAAVCQGYVNDWRLETMEYAVRLAEEDARGARLSDDGAVKFACLLSAVGRVGDADAVLASLSRLPAGAGAQVAWWRLRSIGPLLEQDRSPLGSADEAYLLRWIQRDSKEGGQTHVHAQVSALVAAWADRPDDALACARVAPAPMLTSVAAVTAIQLWLRGHDGHARRAVELLGTSWGAASECLHVGVAHVLAGAPDIGARALAELARRWPQFMADAFFGDTRWFYLALASQALGWETIARQARDASLRCHPAAHAREVFFGRIEPGRAASFEAPEFAFPAPQT